MPMYAFKGVAPSGKAITGVRDAESPKVLRQLLRKDGVHVMSFELSRGGKLAKEQNAKKGGLSRDVDLGGFLGGVKKTEIAAFTRQMSTLLKGMQKIANRIFTGLVLTGLLVASGLLINQRPRLGTTGFVLAAGIALYMVVSILVSDRNQR